MTQKDAKGDGYDGQSEFQHEQQHLEDVVGSIDATIRRKEGRGPVIEGNSRAADIVKDLIDTGLEELRGTLKRPYFGRIDYSTAGDVEARSIYIGETNINNEDPRYIIASRNAPIARLYYSPADGFYEVPNRAPNSAGTYTQRDALVELKRVLQIEDARLVDFEDVLRLPPGRDVAQSTSSVMLGDKLSDASRDQLTDAVQTIQPEQYEQIAATQKPVLIVQGAAGSGKSLIGLHRIDFILSPFSYIGSLSRPTADRVIMFGPSRAFLQYVSGLLPGLGVQNVRQTTVSRWMLNQFSSYVTVSSGDRTFADLMNNRRQLATAEIEAHAFKGGLQMKRLLDNYVNFLRKDKRQRASQAGGLSLPGNPPMQLSATMLRSRVSDAFKAHEEPNAARAYFVSRLAELWARSQRRRGALQSEVIAEARRLIESSLSFWSRFDFRTEYLKLVSDSNKIMDHSRHGDVDLDRAISITRTAPSGSGRALGMTDLAAAVYLDYVINGYQRERFDHVVVDEAQDVSPLEIVLMQMHSSNGSFTILGDLRQSILPYKSISNWNQLAGLFQRGTVSRLESRLTYRSTRQITQYANRILQGLPERTKMPIPYGRGGERPQLIQASTATEMRHSIADSVRRLGQLEDVRSVAVLTKWRQTARDISESLRDMGIDDVSELTQDGLIQTDVIVSPIILTKGLEFDAVIVANARKGNFNESEFDRTLLYLACTRARHYLEIHWYGTRSPIVPDVDRLAR